MTVHFPSLPGALLLLWFPRRWLRRGLGVLRPPRRRLKKNPLIVEPWREREPGDPQIGFRGEFAKGSNYSDLLRTRTGGLRLWGGFDFSPAAVAETDAPRWLAAVTHAVPVLVAVGGLLMQMVRKEQERRSFFPPIFYLAGISIVRCALIWAVNPSLPNARAFLSVYAVLMVLFSRFFGGVGQRPLALAAGLTFLPVFLSLLANRPLPVFARRSHHYEGSSA